MYGLLYKDFIVNKKNMLLLFFVVIFMYVLEFAGLIPSDDPSASLADDMPFLYQTINCISVGSAFMIIDMLQFSIYEQDEKKKFAYYITASEGGIKSHIQEKYLFSYLISVFCMVLCILLNSLAIDIADNGYNDSMLCIVMFFVQIFMKAVEIPFIMAFGSKRGNNVKGILILIVALIALIYFLFGDLSVFGSIDDFWDNFFKLFNVAENPKIIIGMSLAGLGSLACYYVSYLISCRVYLKGVDGYAK